MCVYDGISASPALLRLIGQRRDRARGASPAARGMRRRRYRRRSTDTCSLRERPVCSRRPASPMRATSCTLDEAVHVFVGSGDPCRIAPALLEDRGQPVANALAVVGGSARRTRPAPPPTRGCRSHRLRRAGGRTETRRRSRTPPDRARRRTGPTRGVTAPFAIFDLGISIIVICDLLISIRFRFIANPFAKSQIHQSLNALRL